MSGERVYVDERSRRLGFLLLVDLIELARLEGRPIVVDDPGTEHGRRLLETLGVTVRKPEK